LNPFTNFAFCLILQLHKPLVKSLPRKQQQKKLWQNELSNYDFCLSFHNPTNRVESLMGRNLPSAINPVAGEKLTLKKIL
jgi:hypothetical protein